MFLVIGDYLALVAAFSVAYVIRVKYDPRHLIEQIPASTYIYTFLIILPMWILVLGAIGLYTRPVYENRFREFGRLILGSFLGILVVIGYDFVADDTIFPARLVVVYGLLLGFSFLVVFRLLARIVRHILFSYNIGVDNVLIIGSEKSSQQIIEELADTRRSGHRVIGLVGFKSDRVGAKIFDNFEEAVKKLKTKNLHSIIQTKLFSDESANTDILSYAQQNHIAYRFVPGNQEVFSGNISVELFKSVPVVNVHQTALIGWGRIVKRLFDVILGSLLLVVLSPVILLIIIFQKIFDPRGQVFLKQKRLTQFNRSFVVYKFRSHKSIYNGLSPEQAFANMGSPELVKKYRENGDFLPNDPRVSRLGKLLRMTSLDELPQLFNVLKGDISLVGPRALIPEELKSYKQRHHILSVKSGMTGLAQVSGRRDISFEERRKLDVFYVQNWSFWLDITILLKTLRAVLSGIGAK